MTLTRLSMPEAMMIETFRHNGKTDPEILELANKNAVLAPLRENLESILRDGYTIKFVTFNGLKNLLRLKFDKHIDRDFVATEQGMADLQLETEQVATLQQLLSQNCVLEQESDGSFRVLWT